METNGLTNNNNLQMQLPTNGIMCSFFFTVKLIIKLSTVYRGRAMNQGLATNKMVLVYIQEKKKKHEEKIYIFSVSTHRKTKRHECGHA